MCGGGRGWRFCISATVPFRFAVHPSRNVERGARAGLAFHHDDGGAGGLTQRQKRRKTDAQKSTAQRETDGLFDWNVMGGRARAHFTGNAFGVRLVSQGRPARIFRAGSFLGTPLVAPVAPPPASNRHSVLARRKRRTVKPPTSSEAEAREGAVDGAEIARSKQAHMHERWIEVVEVAAKLVEAGLER